ncbi:MAG: EAL domain-containing protein [Burkholderiaceae bacterium]|jgi:diguanylate cyclase (GGDEF)-like protein|nr:EAL domain-containing protein [Burkholderiaceae bacterium]
MTLRKQLVLIIIMLFALLFVGSFAINVHNTRAYLNDQLRTISQDTATSLGMNLSPYMGENPDVAGIEVHINALYDSGYYRTISVYDTQGGIIVSRADPDPPQQVPGWFINLFRLETPVGISNVMSGWTQAGEVHLSANPEFAYIRLWATCQHSFFWFAGSFAIMFILALIALHYVLRPLQAVESQANAIANKDYVIQEKLPWTIELRSVVAAMNQMSGKIRDIFSEQEEALERVRSAAYTDSVTGLANRAYFTMHLNHLIQSGDFAQGMLLLLEVSNLQAVNTQLGHKAGDDLLRGVAELLNTAAQSSETAESFPARLSGSTFALAVVGVPNSLATGIADRIAESMPSLYEKKLSPTDEIGHLGVTYRTDQTFGQMMSECDMALRAAQIQGINAVSTYRRTAAGGEFDSLTATQWITLLRDVVESQRYSLLLQTTFSASDRSRVLQHEVLLRITDEQARIIPAGVFIPMVNHHRMTQAFDKMVIEDVFSRLRQGAGPAEPIAINLMPASISDPAFVLWMMTILRENPQIAKQLSFELSDYAISQNLHAARVWMSQISTTGARVGIERFGRSNASLDYIGQLKPAYLQIDGSFIRDIDKNRDNQQFVESLVRLSHSHDILVIAEFVETEEELSVLRSLRVDGVRGYALHRPTVWGTT